MKDIPRKPWVISNQYGARFVLSQDNQIILGEMSFQRLGPELIKHIVESVNKNTEPTTQNDRLD